MMKKTRVAGHYREVDGKRVHVKGHLRAGDYPKGYSKKMSYKKR